MSDVKNDTPKPKKKLGKLIAMAGGALLLIGGGVGAGVYAAGAGLMGGGGGHAAEPKGPKLVPKSEQKHTATEGEAGEGDHGGGGDEGEASGGEAVPHGGGGDRYASNYYAMDKEFTSNLRDSVHFVQIGLAVSTPYDDTVLDNLRTNDIAVRSAILLTLGDTTEDQVLTSDGKRKLQKRLADSINLTLRQKEGFGGIANVYFTNFVVQ